jgi:hypothetical protein
MRNENLHPLSGSQFAQAGIQVSSQLYPENCYAHFDRLEEEDTGA